MESSYEGIGGRYCLCLGRGRGQIFAAIYTKTYGFLKDAFGNVILMDVSNPNIRVFVIVIILISVFHLDRIQSHLIMKHGILKCANSSNYKTAF
jgi:hypothetical protein